MGSLVITPTMTHPSLPNPAQSLRDAIWRTLVYYDAFDFPLTLYELWHYLEPNVSTCNGFVALDQLVAALSADPLCSRLTVTDDYIVLQGRTSLIARREMSRQKHYWRRVRWMVKGMQRLPFVRMIAVSGTLALDGTRGDSDIDLFIVAAPGRIWTTRFFCKVLTMLFGLHRTPTKQAGRFCLNHFVTADQLAIDHQNLYTARLFSHLAVSYSLRAYFQFMHANAWINQYVARYPWPNYPPYGVLEDHGASGWCKAAVEKILGERLGRSLESLLRNKQLAHITQDGRRHAASAQVITTDQCLRFHLEAQEPRVLGQFELAMEATPLA